VNTPSNFDKALKDPSLVYQTPREVLSDKQLNNTQRLQILKRWEQDQRELDVAQEEGMIGGETSMLDDILEAMKKLNVDIDTPEAPTKHGGPVG
jgi:hypothetical protein